MAETSEEQSDAERFAQSIRQHATACKHLAFGVSSGGRAGRIAIAIDSADGASVTDIDGNTFVDFTLGFGPLILGHTPRKVIEAIDAEMRKGLRTATNHKGEAILADLISQCVPCAEQTSFVSTGSEAVQLAIRIARAVTSRTRIVRFRANYHGWFDNVFIASGEDGDGPGTVGQDAAAAGSATVLEWGDLEGAAKVLTDEYAAVILEPAAMNAGCFAPPKGFLEGIRELTRRHGIILIYDEVITGFRLALGGAQQLYGVTPDLAVFGKALGAGLPISAVSGRREVMAPVSSGRLSQRGTFNANPICVGAGIACIKTLQAGAAELFPRMNGIAVRLARVVNEAARRRSIPVCANQLGPVLQLFAGATEVPTVRDLRKVDSERTLDLTSELLRRGVYTIPRGLMYLSAAHTDEQIDQAERSIVAALDHLDRSLR